MVEISPVRLGDLISLFEARRQLSRLSWGCLNSLVYVVGPISIPIEPVPFRTYTPEEVIYWDIVSLSSVDGDQRHVPFSKL